MSVFGEQFLSRRNRDKTELDNAIQEVFDAARGNECFHFSGNTDEHVREELEKICFYFGIKADHDIPECDDIEDMVDYITRPYAIMRRRIILKGMWWRNGDGPILALKKDNDEVTALLPGKMGGYNYTDSKTDSRVRINAHNKNEFKEEAVCFYKPLPLRPVSSKEMIYLLIKNLSVVDIFMMLFSGLTVTATALLIPFITEMIFSLVIPTEKITLIWSFAALLIVAAVSSFIVSVIRHGYMDRIKGRMEIYLMHGIMGRIISLPASFFEDKSTGSLAGVVENIRQLPAILIDSVLTPIVNTAFSMLFIIQIAMISPQLLRPVLITFLLQLLIIVICTVQSSALAKKELMYASRIQGMAVAVYDGIQRIKLSGSESRVMANWSGLYSHKASAAYPVYFPASFQHELIAFASMMGMLAAFYEGFMAHLEVSGFAAFIAAFAFLTGSMNELSENGRSLAMLGPILKMSEDILREVPEISKDKKIVRKLSGKIEVRDLSFRYNSESPLIFNRLSLTVNPGEYIAIVGKSGCGKSTLMRILMGFEKASEGNVIYDDIDIDRLDPRSLRRNIGAVMQNGSLFNESIYQNIAISAPGIGMDAAWEVARKAGIAEDIENMPMRMKTLIPQGGGGISGGQKQRIMIARAIAAESAILMFDEATSALDNITQKIVSDSLDELNCTRIVIAHRLSTIRNCDRILVLDNGTIIEQGNYDELIKLNGFFADLVKRQQI